MSYLDLLNGEFSFVAYSANFSIFSLILVLLGLGILFLPIAKSFRFLGLALVMIIFQPVVNLADKYDSLKIHIFDTKSLMVIIQDEGIDTLYISSDIDDYSLQTILQPYLHLEGIEQLSHVVITDGDFNVDMLKSIVSIDDVISKNNGDLACEYSNSWTIKNDTFNLIPYADNCLLNIKNEYKDILIMSAKSSVQKKIYSLYGRTINADIVISSNYLNIDFLEKLRSKYLIYHSNNSVKDDYLDQLKPIDVKVVDTHNNGAITISILSDGHLVIKSLLKSY
jgi:competence protein ComEC